MNEGFEDELVNTGAFGWGRLEGESQKSGLSRLKKHSGVAYCLRSEDVDSG